MSATTTNIEWTDATWNPVRGCSVVSAGCKNCYAMGVAARFSGEGRPFHGFALQSPARWTGKVALVPDALDQPLRWRKPRRIFVNSMSDLFHESLPFEDIDRVFSVMACARQHTFQVLTKRADRMCGYLASRSRSVEPWQAAARAMGYTLRYEPSNGPTIPLCPFPLPNVWLGVSVEDQDAADRRIPDLLATPAAVRFLSVEPLLGPVDLGYRGAGALLVDGGGNRMVPQALAPSQVDWVIVGGESGPGARPCDVAWIRRVVEDCRAASVPCFVKQFGSRAVRGETSLALKDRKGGDPAEWWPDLRVREFPS